MAESSSRVRTPSSGVSHDEVAELSHKDDFHASLLLALRMVFHVALSGAGLVLLNSGHVAAGLLVLAPHFAAVSFLGWAGVGHELFHNSVFSSRQVNQLLFRVFSILTWSNYGYFQFSHWHHHRNTLAPDDAEGIQPPPIGRAGLLLLLTFDFVALLRRVRILAINAAGRVPGAAKGGELFQEGTVAHDRLCHAARVVLATQAGMAFLFLAIEQYWLLLIMSGAPFCLTFFNRTLALAQHYGLSQGGARDDYLNSCRTVLLSPVLGFFYADMNYHVEHHFYPWVPHYRLKALHQLMRSRTKLPHLSRSYTDALREIAELGAFGGAGAH